VRRGVKEKDLNRNKKSTSSSICVSTNSEYNMNDDTPTRVASVVQEGVTSYVVDMTIEMGKQNSLDNNTILDSFPLLSTPVTTTACNAPVKSLYANIIGKLSGKKVYDCTLCIPGGNGIDVVVLVDSIHVISERFANTVYGFFLGKKVAYPVVANYVRNTWEAALKNGPWFIQNNLLILKKWHPNENLLMEDVSTIPVWVKLHSVPVTAFREDSLTSIATKLGAGEKKTVKKHSQTSRGVLKGGEPIIEVSNLNPFDVLNLVDNDVEFCTNEGTTNLVNNEAASNGSSFMNVDNSSSGNPLKKVEFLGKDDGEDKVASVDNDMARSLAYERGFSTQSLLEQWRDSYGNGDYDDDTYDDDMYKGQDLSHELQAISNNLEIHVRGRNKK
nr:hypothetical protein [Tanacetum cinerariifolium]